MHYLTSLICSSLALVTLQAYGQVGLPSRQVLDSAGHYAVMLDGKATLLELPLTPAGKLGDLPVKWGFEDGAVLVKWQDDGKDRWLKFPSRAGAEPIEASSEVGKVIMRRAPWNSEGVRLKGYGIGGKSVQTEWQLPWGSYSKNYVSSRGIVLSLSTLNRVPSYVKLEWAFVLSPGKVIIPGGSEVVKVMQGTTTEFYAPEGTFSENRTELVALGTSMKEGYKYSGWIARALNLEGKVVASAASTPPLDALNADEW